MTRQIDTDAVINSVRLKEQAADPSTPAAGYRNIYTKSTGLYLIDDAGNAMQITPDVIGTAYQILRVNSGATGVEYASVGRVLISEQTPTGTGTLSWASIAATYKSLEIEYIARSTEVATATSINIRMNNDTTDANYRKTIVYGYGTNTSVVAGAANAVFGSIAGASSVAGDCGSGIIKIVNYAGTTFNKQILVRGSYRQDDTTNFQVTFTATLDWESTAAVNRVDLTLAAGNYDTGSTFRLYGVY